MSRWVLCSMGILMACGGASGSRPKLQIGLILPSTGASAATGTRQIEGIGLAVEEINAAGGVKGHDLEMVYRDDASDRAKAKEMATELVGMSVPAILGSGPSGNTLDVSDVTIPAGVVQIAGSSTSPLITSKADNGFLFRTAPSDALQGKLLAKRARDRSHSKVAIIYATGAYGEGLSAAFETSFTAAGGTITIKKQYVAAQTESAYATMLNEIYAAPGGAPEAILLVGAGVTDPVVILKAYINNHIGTGTFFYFTDSVSLSELVTGVGASNFTFQHEGTKPGPPQGNTRFDTFKQAYLDKYSKPAETFAANAYDAAFLLALAIEAASEITGPAIRDQLTPVSRDGTAYGPAQIKGALQAVAAGENVNYEGASGEVDFDSNGDVLGAYDIWEVKSGVITVTQSAVAAPQ